MESSVPFVYIKYLNIYILYLAKHQWRREGNPGGPGVLGPPICQTDFFH